MKKSGSFKAEQKLKNYSALAIGLTSLAQLSQAQILYTDEYPDEIQTDTGTYGLNLNANMYADYSILQGMATSANVVFFNAFTYNEVLGTNSYSYFLPFALSKGDSITENEDKWTSNQGHAMTLNYQGPAGAYGYWQGVQDKYIGLRIKINNSYQYGWVRLDVASDAKSFTIKDMALETMTGKGLAAGSALDGLVTRELEVGDEKDNGNGSDLHISFRKAADESRLTEYRVIVVKLMESFNFSPQDALALSSGNYTTVSKSGSDIDMFLPSTAKDSDGDLISNKNFYRVFILSVPSSGQAEDAVLSTSSKSVVNVNVWAPKVSDIQLADVSDYGDGRDLQVSFNKADDESGILRYKLFVVPSGDTAKFDLSKAQNTGPLLHTKVEKTGNNIITTLDKDTKDIEGNSIKTDKEYVVYVMSVADGTLTTEDNLSEASAPITLKGISGIQEEAEEVNIRYSNRKLYLSGNLNENYLCRIYDLNGKLIHTNNIAGTDTYELDFLSDGFYLVQLSCDISVSTIKIFVK